MHVLLISYKLHSFFCAFCHAYLGTKLDMVIGIARESGTISEEILRGAVSATEDGFLTLVGRAYDIKPLIAATGTCCLVGIIWKGTLYVANLGDSRAVIGSTNGSGEIIAEQLTREHNASREEVRRELRSLHPEDSQIVVMKHGTWRIRGLIQVLFFYFSLQGEFVYCLSFCCLYLFTFAFYVIYSDFDNYKYCSFKFYPLPQNECNFFKTRK